MLMAEIEEFDTDSTDEICASKYVYACKRKKDGEIFVYKRQMGFADTFRDIRINGYGDMFVDVCANTKEEALKKASDKFAKYIAEHMNL